MTPRTAEYSSIATTASFRSDAKCELLGIARPGGLSARRPPPTITTSG
jgi:hypothetical protein